jgi:hypothetical protein
LGWAELRPSLGTHVCPRRQTGGLGTWRVWRAGVHSGSMHTAAGGTLTRRGIYLAPAPSAGVRSPRRREPRRLPGVPRALFEASELMDLFWPGFDLTDNVGRMRTAFCSLAALDPKQSLLISTKATAAICRTGLAIHGAVFFARLRRCVATRSASIWARIAAYCSPVVLRSICSVFLLNRAAVRMNSLFGRTIQPSSA